MKLSLDSFSFLFSFFLLYGKMEERRGEKNMVFEVIYGKTPLGGDYREIYYFTEQMVPCEKEKALRAIVRECKEGGALINQEILVLKK
jgi:hypothetical protein